MEAKLSVAMIGTETAWFVEDSPVRARLMTYAEGLAALHVVIFTKRSQGFGDIQIGENIFIHPTNTRTRLFASWRAARLLRQPLDVISAQDPFDCGFAAWRVARRLGAALEVQVHTDVFSREFATASVANRVRVLLARFVLPRATTIRVVSAKIRDSLPAALQSKIFVLPIFTQLRDDPAREGMLRERFAAFDFRVLMVGRLEVEKRFAQALELFAAVQKKLPNICLIVVGSGSEKAALGERARELGIESRVFFEGQQHNPAPYYRVADLLLHTSRYEGYGQVIVEARLAGMPVLSSDVGVAREVGAHVAHMSEMTDALYRAALKGPSREAPLPAPYATMREYSEAIRVHWAQCAHHTS